MFLIFGDKHRTEPVHGGLRTTRTCERCGVKAEFRERRVSKQFRLYFIEMFTHGTHHVLECGACGTCFVTDELAAKNRELENDQGGTIYGHLRAATAEAKTRAEALARSPEVDQALARGREGVTKAATTAREKLGGLMASLRADEES